MSPTPATQLPPHQECPPSGTHRCSSSFLFSRADWEREQALGEWGSSSQLLPGVRAGAATLGPRYLQSTAEEIVQQGGEREGLRAGGGAGEGGRKGGGGHSHPQSCPPALARPSASPPPAPAAPTAAAGSACRGAGLLSACTRPLPPLTRPLQPHGRGCPPPGGSSPQLGFQPVARAVGVLQEALQLLLPLPVGRLLLAQLLVLQLKPQERLPAEDGSERGWRRVTPQACWGSGRDTGTDRAGRGTEPWETAQPDPGAGSK